MKPKTKNEYDSLLNRGAEKHRLANAQAVIHWRAVTVARAEELKLVGLHGAASSLLKIAESMGTQKR